MFKPIVSYLRLNGLRIVIFFRRHLTYCKLFSRVCGTALFITKVTGELRFFVINDATSQLRPVTKICLLSFIIDSVSMKRLLPTDKLEEIVSKKLISI